MNPHPRYTGRRRRAFSMTEMLAAATVTSLTAAAGATFISGVSNASLTTRDVRAAKTSGSYALGQIVRTIREARGIGQVGPNSVTLWINDTNGDDRMNLFEVGTIRYDAMNRRVLYEYMQPATAGAPSATVVTDDFKEITLLRARTATPERKELTWANDVDALTFLGYPNHTDTRVVDVRLAIGSGGLVVFRGSASPRASADYLFYFESQGSPLPGSTRKPRKYVSTYKGISTLLSTVGSVTGLDL